MRPAPFFAALGLSLGLAVPAGAQQDTTAPAAPPPPAEAPLFASHGGLPPLLIQVGSDDLLAPDAELLADSACAAGTDVTSTRWPGMWHDFTLQPGILAAADSALSQAAWFLGSGLGA